MHKGQPQKIFKRQAVEKLRLALRSGASMEDYFKDSFRVQTEDTLSSLIDLQGKAPVLEISKNNPPSSDFENAVLLHSYYRNLDETQASDPRLWIYLSHVQFRKYCLSRWGLPGFYKDLKDDRSKEQAKTYIFEHWFISGNDRDLRRHAIARLWWAAHLTYAPWERDPEFFADLQNKDPYYFTRILFSTQDIYQQVLERGMGRSSHILISILDYLDKNKGFAQSREKIRSLMKELNLTYGAKKIIVLDRPSLKKLIARIAEKTDIIS